MAGYIRQDVTDQISNGNIIDAIPLDQEFDAITSAFAGVGGHKHDGSVGEGAPITVVGPAQDLIITSSSVSPKTDNDLDLGAVGKEFKNAFITGVANIDSLIADTADINAGTVDGTAIGLTTPSTGAFTTLSSSGLSALASATVGGVAVTTASNTQTLTGKTINLANNTFVATSAQMQASVTDEAGTGSLVFSISPNFTGAPTVPTAAVNTNTTQIASTAFVVSQIADDAPSKTGVGATGSWGINADTATAFQTARTINGTSFNGTANISTAFWGTPITMTFGATGKSVDGNSNLSWSLAEIGAQASNVTLDGFVAMSNTAGVIVQTAANTFTPRTIAVGAGTGLSIVNGSGAAGNPTVSGVVQTQATWDAGVATTESVISPEKLSNTITLLKNTSSANQTTTSGTAFNFSGIPSYAKRVTVCLRDGSLTTNDQIIIQLGTSGGIVATGYLGGIATRDGGGSMGQDSSTIGMPISWGAAGDTNSSVATLVKMGTTNSWGMTVLGTRAIGGTYNGQIFGSSEITLASALTQLRLTRVGAGTFDSGTVAIMWE